MDSKDPVVKLCSAGVAAERRGNAEEAKACFEAAWQRSEDEFGACLAAHYLARHQSTAAAELEWNLLALTLADTVPGQRARGLYATLHLSLARALERNGRLDDALQHYGLAAERARELPQNPHRDGVWRGIEAGRRRIGDRLSERAAGSRRARESPR